MEMKKEVEPLFTRFYRKSKEVDMTNNQNEFYLQPLLVEGGNIIINNKNNYLKYKVIKYENEETQIYKYGRRVETINVIKIFKLKVRNERSMEAIEMFENIGLGALFIEKFSELMLIIDAVELTLRYSILVKSFSILNDGNINEITVETNINSSVLTDKKISVKYNQKNMNFKILYHDDDEILYKNKVENTFERLEELLIIKGIRSDAKIWYEILLSDLIYYILVKKVLKTMKNWKIAKEFG